MPIEIVDKGLPILFSPNEKEILSVDITKAMSFFGIKKLRNPKETIFEIVKKQNDIPKKNDNLFRSEARASNHEEYISPLA